MHNRILEIEPVVTKKINKDQVLKEFVRSLSDESIRFVCSRLGQRLAGDVGELVEFLQNYPAIDELLQTAESNSGFFDLIDEIDEYSEREIRKRADNR